MKRISIFLPVLFFFFTLTAAGYEDPLVDSRFPGLQTAIEKGFTTDFNLTAEPAMLEPDIESSKKEFEGITSVNETIVIDNVSMTLKWLYKEIGRTVISVEAENLPEGMTFGMPDFTYERVYSNDGFVIPESKTMVVDGNRLLVVAYEVGNPKNDDQKIDIGIDVPLVAEDDVKGDPAAVFHFALTDYFVPIGQNISWEQTRSVIKNGFEMQLRQTRLLEDRTYALICHDALDGAENRQLGAAALIQNGVRLAEQEERISFADPAALKYQCEWLVFPKGTFDTALPVNLRFDKIGAESDPASSPAEEFDFFITLPSEPLFPELPEKSVSGLPQYNADDVRMTLDWGYADETRLTLGYRIEGIPYTPNASVLKGKVSLRTAEGEEEQLPGFSHIRWADPDKGIIQGIWDLQMSSMQHPLGDPPYQISFILDGSGKQGNMGAGDLGYFESVSMELSDPIHIPDRLIGSFDFEVDLPVYPGGQHDINLESTANGIVMRLVRVKTTPAASDMYLCYQKPSDRDWALGISDGHVPQLEVGDVMISNSQYGLLYDKDFGGWMTKSDSGELTDLPAETDGRCIILSFEAGKTEESEKMKLTIPYLMQSRPEVIPTEEIDTIRDPLKALGIEFVYSTFHGSGGGGGGIDFLSIPDGMTETEALEQIWLALGYFWEGPWTFEFEL